MIMRMRFGVSLIMVLVLGVALVGCGGGSSSSSTPPPVTPAVTLKSIAVSGPGTAFSGQTGLQYKATGTYSDGSTKDLTLSATWSSSVGVVTINSSGSATAVAASSGGVKPGAAPQTVTITATSGSIKNSALLTVSDGLVTVAVTPPTPNISASTTETFTATGTFQDGSSQQIDSSVTWKSSPTSVATISSSGVATGVATGQATISATCSSTSTPACPLNLAPLVSSPSASTSLTVTAAGGGGLVSIAVKAASSSTLVLTAPFDQLTATGTYASGPNQNITSSVTWSVSSSTGDGAANVNYGGTPGLIEGTHSGTVTIQAKLGTISGFSVPLTVTPVLSSLTISPLAPGMVVGGNQQFSVSGTYNDGTTNSNLTSMATWTDSKNGAVVTFTGAAGLASGVSQGQDNVTAAIKSLSGANVSASTPVNVVPPGDNSGSLKNGQYAFTLLGANANGPVFYAGTFVANDGNITLGEVDENAAGVVSTKVALIGGGYTVYPDGRGTLTFIQNAMFNTPGGITFRFILSDSGKLGKLIEFDNLGTLKGTMWQQTGPVTNPLNGNYVFRASGIDSSANPIGEVGFFNTTGGGSINTTGGTVDVDDFSVDSFEASLCSSEDETCTINVADSLGRGTLTVVENLVGGATTTTYAYYVVTAASEGAPTLMNLIETDNNGAGGAAVAGAMALQVGATGGYTASTLDNFGNGYAFLLDRPVASASCSQCNVTEFGQVGEYTFTNTSATAGTLVGIRDDSNPPAPGNPFTVTGKYLDVTSNGRGIVATLGAEGMNSQDGNRGYTFYMVSRSQAYVLQDYTDYNTNPPTDSYNAPVGEMDAQAGSFSTSTIVGEYALDASDVSSPGLTTDLIWLSFVNTDGNITVTGIVDSSVGSSLTSTIISSSIIDSVTYTLPIASAGRVLLSVTTQSQQTSSFVLYLVSSQNSQSSPNALVLSVPPAPNVLQVLDGSLNQQ